MELGETNCNYCGVLFKKRIKANKYCCIDCSNKAAAKKQRDIVEQAKITGIYNGRPYSVIYFERLQKQAKQREIECTINYEYYLDKIWQKPCFYCGKEGLNGADRIDSDKDYENGNIVPCCYRCNVMKASLMQKDFIKQCKRIIAYQRSKNKVDQRVAKSSIIIKLAI